MARTLVQIDGGYVDAIMRKSFKEARIDYHKLVKEVLAGDELSVRITITVNPIKAVHLA